jgi:hypothetical protein
MDIEIERGVQMDIEIERGVQMDIEIERFQSTWFNRPI